MTNQNYPEPQQMLLFAAKSKLEEAFWRFHEKHPEVYWYLMDYANEWRRKFPERHCGINMLMERVRWELQFNYDKAPKLNNNHAPYYARLLEDRNPYLRGIFKMRKQRMQATIGPDQSTLEENIHVIE